MNPPIIIRGSKKPWVTYWDEEYGAWIYRTHKSTYVLIINSDEYKPVYIARELRDLQGRLALVTNEKEIGATSVVFSTGEYVFK